MKNVLRPVVVLAVVIAAPILGVGCGSGDTTDFATSEEVAVEVDDTDGTIAVQNTTGQVIELARAVGLESWRDGKWIDAADLLEELAGVPVVPPLSLIQLTGGATTELAVPMFDQLPPGDYRVTVAYSAESNSGTNKQARATFTKSAQ